MKHIIWASVSRTDRMPSRFDDDLRFTSGFPFVVLRGDSAFVSENAISAEAGYRHMATKYLSFDASAFASDYTDLRTLEPTPPTGIPIVISNKMSGRTS